MVTTNSFAIDNIQVNPHDFRYVDCLFSSDESERALGERSEQAYVEMMRRLKPILKYVANERGMDRNGFVIHYAKVYSDVVNHFDIVLTHAGFFGIWLKGTAQEPIDLQDENFWETLPFCSLLTGLQQMLEKAEEKKRQNADAIASRREFVEGILKDFQK